MPARKLGNWLEAYREYTAGTESPASFHLWVALGTIAAAAQRKVFMDAGYFHVHSNMFIILVSPPGKSRKSTALRIGKNLLVGMKDYGHNINFSTQASSVAALVQQLSSIQNKDHQSLTAFSSELGTLLGTKSPEMIDFLVDIYDADPNWDKQTVARKLEKIDHPWFNLLAATTPQWMGDNLSKTAVEGGFVSRSVFIYDDTRLLVAFPELTDAQRKIKKDLMFDLAIIAGLKGQFMFHPQAKKDYQKWYEDPQRLIGATDYRTSGFYEREHIHVLKVAMMLSLAAKDELVLMPEEIGAAIMLLEDVKPGLKRAFSAVGKNTYGTTIERIRDQILTAGKVHYKKVLAANIHDVTKDELDKLLESLDKMGEIIWNGMLLMSPTYRDQKAAVDADD